MKTLTEKYYDNEELTTKERDKIFVGKYRLNKAKCLKCGDEIQSTHRHDFVTCSCDNLSVDGGSWYLRRCFKEDDSYKDMSVTYKDVVEKEEEELSYDI